MERSEAGKKGYEKTKDKLDAHRAKRTREAIERYLANPNICPTCGEIVPFEKRRNKFCNSSCSASHNNRGKVRVKTVNPVHCAHCGEVKEIRQNKYCNICIAEGVYNEPPPLEEIKSEPGVRKYLLRTREHKCECCTYTEWLGLPIPLEVHHVDGNSDNNTEENLQLLCPNCHALTDTFKGAAKGNSGRYSERRVKRRKRYKDGKTW